MSVGHPVLYWRGADLILHEPVSGERLVVGPFAVSLLQFMREPRTDVELRKHFAHVPLAALKRAVADLVSHRLVCRRQQSGEPSAHPLDAWGPLAPEASFYHFATRDPDIPHGERLQAIEDHLEATSETDPDPLRTSATATHVLDVEPLRDRFSETLRARRTWRVFDPAPLPHGPFSQLLHLTFGVQSWAKSEGGQPVPLKTSPSAGARHPIACYVAAARVEGLPPGLYRYADGTHALDRIRSGMTSARIERYLGRQWWFARAAAVVFFVGHIPRISGRYAHPRAYRLLLLDAGHLCQTFCLTATWLELAPFCTAALADSRIERDLGLDGVRDIVLYAAGVGVPPPSGYRQWPEHEAGRGYVRPLPANADHTGRGSRG